METNDVVGDFKPLDIRGEEYATELSLYDHYLAIGHPKDGNSRVAPDRPSTVHIFDLETSEEVTRIERPDSERFGFSVELLDDRLIVGGENEISEYTYAGDLIRTLEVPFAAWNSASIAVDEDYLIVMTASEDQGFPVHVYDRETLDLLAVAKTSDRPKQLALHDRSLAVFHRTPDWVDSVGDSAITVFTIPEPQHSALALGFLVLCAFRSSRTRRHSLH